MNCDRHFLLTIAAWSALSIGLLSCGNQRGPSPTVSIQSTFPSGEEPLVAGDSLALEVIVRAQGLSGPSRVGMVVQSADGKILGGCEPISISNGVLTRLAATISVPDTTTVRVFTPMYFGNSDKTDVLDIRSFKVVGKRAKE